jgi:hypothetical protein
MVPGVCLDYVGGRRVGGVSRRGCDGVDRCSRVYLAVVVEGAVEEELA